MQWPWLHFDDHRDLAFCFICFKAYVKKELHSTANLESTYILTGYSNWKEVVMRFKSHQTSICHKDAVLKTVTLPATHDIRYKSLRSLPVQSILRVPVQKLRALNVTETERPFAFRYFLLHGCLFKNYEP